MSRSDYFLSNCGVQFDPKSEVQREEVEHHIQARYQGIKPIEDYIFQSSYPKGHWQLNGITQIGARAIASVGSGMHLLPNRLDISLEHTKDHMNGGLDFSTCAHYTSQWIKEHKPTISHEFLITGSGLGRFVIGARTARWSLIMDELTEPQGTRLTFRVRQDNVLPAWDYLGYYFEQESFYNSCKAAFEACTNTFLAPDFFGLGLSKEPYLKKEKVERSDNDYWGFLAGVANKIISECNKRGSMHLADDSIFFLKDELGKALIRRAKVESERAATLDGKGKGYTIKV